MWPENPYGHSLTSDNKRGRVTCSCRRTFSNRETLRLHLAQLDEELNQPEPELTFEEAVQDLKDALREAWPSLWVTVLLVWIGLISGIFVGWLTWGL